MEFTLFSQGQGSGYISENSIEIYNQINQTPISLNNKIINPGTKTSLDNHFCREVKYLGVKINNLDTEELIFELGYSEYLFNKTFYYQSIFKISENRIMEIFKKASARDFIFINGKWK